MERLLPGYEYSPDGLRQVKRGGSGTIHYVFEGTEPIFEKRISDSRVRSYVYVLGKHLARVDGVIGDQAAKVYYYHTDQVGSVKAVTDEAGKVVHKADYFAFGSRFEKSGEFDESHGFTGKEYDSDTGLYYYNARWYDSELGRFISEDPVGDPNNPNLYSYCRNNPVNMIDPTGLYYAGYTSQSDGMAEAAKHTSTPAEGSSISFTTGNSPSSSGTGQPNPGTPGTTTFTGIYGANGELSSVTATTIENTDSPGVTKTTSRYTNFNSEGDVVSRFVDTTYNKEGGGTVTISESQIGNYRSVYYVERDKDGNVVYDGVVTSVTLFGLRGWGTGYISPLMEFRGESPYNDAFVVATSDGRVGFIDTANFEGSTAKFIDDEGRVHDGLNPSIADGVYSINYGYHKGYPALWVNNNNQVDIQQRENPNPPAGRDYMDYCHIHIGGDGWNWSEGCLTVHYSQWSNFMSYFNSNPKGTNNGKYAGTLVVSSI
jgi:RHS repeat-associated protein